MVKPACLLCVSGVSGPLRPASIVDMFTLRVCVACLEAPLSFAMVMMSVLDGSAVLTAAAGPAALTLMILVVLHLLRARPDGQVSSPARRPPAHSRVLTHKILDSSLLTISTRALSPYARGIARTMHVPLGGGFRYTGPGRLLFHDTRERCASVSRAIYTARALYEHFKHSMGFRRAFYKCRPGRESALELVRAGRGRQSQPKL